MATTYRSKLDAWLIIVLAVTMIVSLAAGIGTLASADGWAAWITLGMAVLLGIGLPLWLLLSTRYIIDRDHLRVRSGPFRWRVPLAAITDISATRNPISSPALSLDRLRIDYGRGRQLLISPRDKAGFLNAIEQARQRLPASTG